MAILKNDLKAKYTKIPNNIIDADVSDRAFRLLTYLYSKPSDWEVNQKNIANDLNKSLKTISTTMQELKDKELIIVEKIHIKGRFDYIYTLNYNEQLTTRSITIRSNSTGKKPTLHNKTNTTKTDNTKTNIKEIIKEKFSKPTVEDVEAYCLEKDLKVDAEYFIDHYESNGWVVGRTKMKDWKATVRNWSKRNFNNNNVTAKATIGDTEHWYQDTNTNNENIDLDTLRESLQK